MHHILQFILCYLFITDEVLARADCGCKTLRPCYEEMIDDLKFGDETSCIEKATIGTSTLEVYLRALEMYCSEVITVNEGKTTFEGRTLFEVILEPRPETPKERQAAEKVNKKPIILLEAGQQAGSESVGLALYFIQQLVACHENSEMLNNVKWVFLPCTNPDGMEYAKNLRADWHKNQRNFPDKPGIGVDISRNFDVRFTECKENLDPISPNYAGESPNSEFESEFISDAINRHISELKAYVSIRRNGHSILYPYAGSDKVLSEDSPSRKAAELMSAKANHKINTVHQFDNMSIYEMNGEKQCGSSVDYAHNKHIKIALELRVFVGEDNSITSMFQTLPKGYDSTLRMVYTLGLKELYNIVATKMFESQPPAAQTY